MGWGHQRSNMVEEIQQTEIHHFISDLLNVGVLGLDVIFDVL